MSKVTDKTSQQFESIFVSPVRTYTLAALNYYEELVSAQMEAAKAYSDITLAQARTWLEVKDADSLKKALESQQKSATELMERVKGDAEKVASLSQGFVQESQKLAEETTKKATDAAKQ